MANLKNEIQIRINAFARDLTALLAQAVSEAAPAPVKRGPGRPRKIPSLNAAPKPAKAPKAGGRGVGESELLAFVKKNPNQRMEQIAKALRSKSTTLNPVMKKLIAAKKVKVSGQARGTNYRAV